MHAPSFVCSCCRRPSIRLPYRLPARSVSVMRVFPRPPMHNVADHTVEGVDSPRPSGRWDNVAHRLPARLCLRRDALRAPYVEINLKIEPEVCATR
jgi:hypothetical protein